MYKFLLLGGAFIVATILTIVLFNSNKGVQQAASINIEPGNKEKKIPFEELTIPYLRNRKYQSVMGDLDPYQEKNSHRSYLTNFTSDGLKINALLTIPKGEAPKNGWPAIVFVHGYIPPTQYKTTEKYIEYIDYLARNGIVVLKIDLRGHGSSQGEPGGAYYSSDYVIDTLNAHEALKQIDSVDSEKIFLWGHSMAGNVVFRAGVVKKDIPKVFLWAGAVYSYADFAKYGIDDNSYRPANLSTERQKKRQQLFDTHGQYSDTSSFWKKVDGTNYLDGVSTKFIIQHAINDSVVNIGYSRDLDIELKRQGNLSSLFEYKTGGHNITGPSFNQAMTTVVDEVKAIQQPE